MRISRSLSCLCGLFCVLFPLSAQEEVMMIQELGASGSSDDNTSGIPVLVENAPDHSAGFAVFAKRIPAIPANALPGILVYRNGQYNPYMGVHREGNLPSVWTWRTEDGTENAVGLTQEYSGKIILSKPSKDRHSFNFSMNVRDADYAIQVMQLDPILKEIFKQLKEGPEENWEARSLLRSPGTLMLFAVRLHQVGRTDEANQLVTYLFNRVGDKKQVLMAGLSSLADEAYADLMRVRRETGENEAFVAGCEALLQEQGRYWRHSAEMAELIPKWKTMLALPEEYVPEVKGLSLSEDQKALYRELWAAPEVMGIMQSSFSHVNWLLAPRGLISQQVQYGVKMAEGAHNKALVMKTHRMGLEALPVFAAMLEDPRFAPPVNEEMHHRMIRHVSYSSSDKPTLPKPATLSQSAISILDGVKPTGPGGWDENKPENALPSVLGHVNRLQGKSRDELALFYLNQVKNWNTPTEAIYTLASSEDPQHHEAVKKWVSTMENPHSTIAIFLDIHGQKPELGAEFLTMVKTRLQQPAMKQRFGGSDDYMKRMLEQIDDALNIEPEKPEDTTGPSLSEAIQGWIEEDNPHNSTGMISILSAAKPMSMKEIQQGFAEEIRNADSKVAQLHLLHLIHRVVEQGGVEMYRGGPSNNQMVFYLNPEEEEMPEEQAVQEVEIGMYDWEPTAWLPLLEDDSNEHAQYLGRILGSIILTSLYFDTGVQNGYELLYHIRPMSDTGFNRKVADWAAELLKATEDIPELNLPSSDAVDEERKAAMEQILKSGSADEVSALLTESTDSERLALVPLLQQQSLNEREEVKDRLLQEVQTVDSIIWMDKERLDLGLKPGDRLDLDTINRLLALAAEQAKAGKKGSIQLATSPLYRGTTLSFQRSMIGNHYGKEPGVVLFGVGANQASFHVTLPLDAFPLTLKEPSQEQRKEANENALLLLMGEADEEPENAGTEASRYVIDGLKELPSHHGMPRLTLVFLPASTTP